MMEERKPKYIRLDDLFVCETCFHNGVRGCKAVWCDTGESYRPAVSKLKLVDAVEVVRCKDCVHRDDHGICEVFSDYGGDISDPHLHWCDKEDFCSYGERRRENIEWKSMSTR